MASSSGVCRYFNTLREGQTCNFPETCKFAHICWVCASDQHSRQNCPQFQANGGAEATRANNKDRPCRYFNKKRNQNVCTKSADECEFSHSCSKCGSFEHGRGRVCKSAPITAASPVSAAEADVNNQAAKPAFDLPSVPVADEILDIIEEVQQQQQDVSVPTGDFPKGFKTRPCRHFNRSYGCRHNNPATGSVTCCFSHVCSHCGGTDHANGGKCTNPRALRLTCEVCGSHGIVGTEALNEHTHFMH